MERTDLTAQIVNCERCELHAQCTLPVPFSGEPGPIVVLGEAPGEQEDRAGKPFVGPAGQLIRTLLTSVGLDPDTLAWCNAVSCFPNGTPTWDQVRSCAPNRTAQLAYLNPTHILLLGKIALRSLRPDLDISAGRGRPFLHDERICYATYHPAAALRNGKYERALKRDLTRFAAIVHAGADWQSHIPDDCSRCDNPATVWETSGLGWCDDHVPERLRAEHDQRRQRQADELLAARRRDQALAQVADAANDEWMTAAWDALLDYLRTHTTFFVDDFWIETKLARPREARALGPVVQRAAREGLMRKSGQFRKSTASNLTEKPLWTSLVYVKPT